MLFFEPLVKSWNVQTMLAEICNPLFEPFGPESTTSGLPGFLVEVNLIRSLPARSTSKHRNSLTNHHLGLRNRISGEYAYFLMLTVLDWVETLPGGRLKAVSWQRLAGTF
ncbi:hypothetical protein [Larkinella knui]|uniref:Uncharacterized protein n=1 Tax=Larkinella knui TaxID=2025310 RepID=A0A3P1CRA3_9BACT|nr:hypothetical protein [Larkinella knui]RRB15494.1 hypothetical protein EHT87_13290 [Larkinella knui]